MKRHTLGHARAKETKQERKIGSVSSQSQFYGQVIGQNRYKRQLKEKVRQEMKKSRSRWEVNRAAKDVILNCVSSI